MVVSTRLNKNYYSRTVYKKSITLEHHQWQLTVIDDTRALAIINHSIKAPLFHVTSDHDRTQSRNPLDYARIHR